MRPYLGLSIALILLAYGLVRIGVGSALMAQSLTIVDFPDLAEAVEETRVFLEARAHKRLFAFTVPAYFGYILAMGLLLAGGAAGVIAYQRWGYALLVVYLSMHGALFINYQEINPKLIVLVLQVVLLGSLYYLRPPRSPG